MYRHLGQSGVPAETVGLFAAHPAGVGRLLALRKNPGKPIEFFDIATLTAKAEIGNTAKTVKMPETAPLCKTSLHCHRKKEWELQE